MRRQNLALVPPHPEDEPPELDAVQDSLPQTMGVVQHLDLPPDAHLVLPFPSLHDLLGAWSPGELHMACAFSGGGKTLFVANLELALLRERLGVYHIGLETRPALVRLHMACLKHGVYYGDVVSGAAKAWPDWEEIKRTLKYDMDRQRMDAELFAVNPTEWLDVQGLTAALREAHALGSALVVIDHVDHLATPDGMSLYQASVQTIRHLHTVASRLGLRVLGLSQLNNDAVRGDRLAVHLPPRPEQVYMGGHKRQVCTTMLGIYRPLRDDANAEEIKAVREGRAEPMTVVAPDVMALVCMKNRNHGNREGKRAQLRVERGRLSEIPERDKYATAPGVRGPRL